MSWHAKLELNYRRDTLAGAPRTTGHARHVGPLRVLASLYPEGPQVCHHVLVHPPGGIVGGDALEVRARLDAGTHALLTTPGATRYYRSAGAPATQDVAITVEAGARLEWLPLETIVHAGALGLNRLRFELAPGAQMIGWDVLALGLPASGETFDRGRFEQALELPGVWLERLLLDPQDGLTPRLLHSPLGWAGHTVLGCLWFAAGQALPPAARDGLLEDARTAADAAGLAHVAGASSPHDPLVVLRVLGARTEPVLDMLKRVRAVWRQRQWGLDAAAPRVWRT